MPLDVTHAAPRLTVAAVLRGPVAVVSALALLPAMAAHGADSGRASAALKRACATGALTPYACAQHGIKVDGASAAATPAPQVASPPPSQVPAASSPPRPVASTTAAASAPASPTGSRSRHARSTRSQTNQTANLPAGSIRLYSDTQGRYTINIPEGWVLTSDKGFPSLRNGEAWIQLRDAAGANARAATSAALASLNSQFSSFQAVSGGDQTFGGRAAYSTTLNAMSRAGRKSALMIVTAPEGGGQYVAIVGGASAEDAATVTAGVAAVAKSLWFKAR